MADELGALLAQARERAGAGAVVQVVATQPAPRSRPLVFDQVAARSGAGSIVLWLDLDGPSSLDLIDGSSVLRVHVPQTFRSLATALTIDEPSARAWYESVFPSPERQERSGLLRRRPTGAAQPVAADPAWFVRAAPGDRPAYAHQPRRSDLALAAAVALTELAPGVVHTHDRLSLELVHAWSVTAQGRPRLVHHAGLPEVPAASLALADAVTVSTDLVAGLVRAAGVPDPVVVTGVPVPSGRRERLLPPGSRIVATAWRPGDTRLAARLVEALEHLPHVHLVLAGTRGSAALTEVLQQAARLGVRPRVHTEATSGPDGVVGSDLVVVDAEGDAVPVALAHAVEAGCRALVLGPGRAADLSGSAGIGDVLERDAAAGAVAERIEALLAGIEPSEAPAPHPDRLVDCYSRLLGRELVAPTSGAADPGSAPGTPPAAAVSPSVAGPRLGIGPANYAGQASAWAAAARDRHAIAAASFGRPSKFDYPFDQVLPDATDEWGRASRLAWAVTSYDLLLLDGMLPLSEGFLPGGLREELMFLLGHDIGVGVVCHGSEIRDPDRHLARLPESYFRGAPQAWIDRVRSVVAANAAILADLAEVPVLVSTPDLLIDVPRATWLPLTVDVEHWRAPEPVLAGSRPRVLHAPSRSVPPVKGTHLIEPELQRLHELGVIEYVAASGLVHAEMRALVHSVDIVVDQILTGSYGVAACEAMAAGRLVVGFVADDVAALMPERPPIVDVRGGDIRTAMEGVLDDLDSARALAASGPSFTADWHDGRRAAEVIAGFVQSVSARTEGDPR